VDVKYILLESMSHHMFPGLVASMDWDNLDNILQEISKFHGDYQREAADLIILAYRHNTYSKVLEFVAFKGRLERSFQHLVVRIESIMLSLKRKANKLEEFENALSSLKGGQVALEWVTDTQLGALSFNEDLQTRPWWSPAPDECLLTGAPLLPQLPQLKRLG
jgi:N-terminal acetyltransferase B complex non-catalytic subunit